MTVAQWAWLLLLPAVLALAMAMSSGARAASARAAAFFGAGVLERIRPPSVLNRRVLRERLLVLSLVFGVLALAEPRFGREMQTIRATGSDVVIVLDLSRSMDAADVEPSRLTRAKREVADLLALVQGDRVGLVVFAGGAFPHVPLTVDSLALERVVDELRTNVFEGQGSSVGAGLRAGMKLLSRGHDQAGKAVILLSDGEDHDPDDARAAADELAAEGIPVFALAIGSGPAPIPSPEGGYIEEGGARVSSTPNPELLADLARRSGGAFASSVPSDADVAGLYAELRRSVAVVEREVLERETWRSGFQLPLGFSVLALFAAVFLGDGRAAVLALVLLAPIANAADADQARRLYDDAHYDAAAKTWSEVALSAPGDAGVLERLAAARYRAGDFEGAARAYDEAWRSGAGLDTLYGAGNAHWQAGRLDEAARRFEAVVKQQDGHTDAAFNRDLLNQELAARRAAQPPPPPPKGDEGEGENPQDGGPEDPKPSGSSGDPADGAPPEQAPSGQPQEPGPGGPTQDGEPDGEPPAPGETDGVAGEPQEEPTLGEGAAADGTPTDMTAAQANRLLDSVEEGHAPILVSGGEGAKPW